MECENQGNIWLSEKIEIKLHKDNNESRSKVSCFFTSFMLLKPRWKHTETFLLKLFLIEV